MNCDCDCDCDCGQVASYTFTWTKSYDVVVDAGINGNARRKYQLCAKPVPNTVFRLIVMLCNHFCLPAVRCGGGGLHAGGRKGITQGVLSMYFLYVGSLPHFFSPAASTSGTPLTFSSSSAEKAGESHAACSFPGAPSKAALLHKSDSAHHIVISPK